jgi:lipoyl(octanoyl) transferase
MRLAVRRLGVLEYRVAMALQERCVAQRTAGDDDVLLLLEHRPVYTLGRAADPRFLGAAAGGDVPIVQTSRGGQVTYHGPGQLVGYPILDLRAHRCDVRWYVHQLEAVLIDALGRLGVAGERRLGAPGVWTHGRKVASIGIAIRRWVTWHDFALNVGVDLEAFERITPCGLDGVSMTSLESEGVPVRIEDVTTVVREEFVRLFGYASWRDFGAEEAPPAPEVWA